MGKNPHLRRSRSWRDISALMSKKLFGTEEAPEVPLHRSSSLGRSRRKRNDATKSRMFHDFEIDDAENVPTVEEQRAKERAFQRGASTKRKPVPISGHNSPQHITRPPRPSTQLPGFTFSTQELEKAKSKPSTSTRHNPPSLHSRSQSVATAHSRMASEMSIPMVLDFDLQRHQDSAMFSPNGGLNFGFEVIERQLSEEERADLINTVPAMHVVNINKLDSKSSKPNALKRLFSLRRNEKPSSTKHSPSSSSSSKRSNSETSNAKTIYARPPAIHSKPLSPPLSPTHPIPLHKRDAPPRLTVQIPDSTMDRASKIFQSIYAAHAQAQEALVSQWGVHTPPSESPSSSRPFLHGHEKSGRTMTAATNVAGRGSPPKGKSSWGFLPHGQSPKAKKGTPQAKQSLLFHSTTGQAVQISTPIELHSQVRESGSRGNNRVVSMRGRISAFPVAPSIRSVPRSSLSDVEDSEEEDFDEPDDEWENNSYLTKKRVSLKEPMWEMLTPPTRVAA